MSNALKSAAALAAVSSLVNLISAPVVTEAMIAEAEAIMGPCPPHIREGLLGDTNPTPAEKVPSAAAGLAAIEAMFDAMENGTQITPEMLASVEVFNGEPAPAEVVEAINTLNLLHGAGFRQDTPKPNTILKDPAKFMDPLDENDVIQNAVKKAFKDWESSPELSDAFPVMLGCAILHAFSQVVVDVNTDGRGLLRCIDKTRAAVCANLGIEA